MMLYELDDVERKLLLDEVATPRLECVCHKFICLHDGNCPVHGFVRKQVGEPRPGEKVQRWYCADCDEYHEASVLGGAIVEQERKDEHEI